MFSLICAWTYNQYSSDLRRHRAHNDVTVITKPSLKPGRWWLKNTSHCFTWNIIIYPCPNPNPGLAKKQFIKTPSDHFGVCIFGYCGETYYDANNVLHMTYKHDDVIKWKYFPRYWPFVRGIHRSPVNSPHKGQWLGALMFSLICAWMNTWVNNREAGELRRYRAYYDATVMKTIHNFPVRYRVDMLDDFKVLCIVYIIYFKWYMQCCSVLKAP